MARDRFIPEVSIENTRIMFRNFAGKEGQFNRAGDRNFAVPLDPEIATRMIEDGWNVKQLRPREEGDQPQDYVQVSVSYKGKPPRIVLVTSRGRTELKEEELDILDYAEIANVDLILNPYKWTIPARGKDEEKSGVKAYLKAIYITLKEDDFEKKYANVPESAASVRHYDNDED
jgi:hypothetical protein